MVGLPETPYADVAAKDAVFTIAAADYVADDKLAKDADLVLYGRPKQIHYDQQKMLFSVVGTAKGKTTEKEVWVTFPKEAWEK